MADWPSLLRDLGLGTSASSTSTKALPLGMGQADFGVSVQQLIHDALTKSKKFDEANVPDLHPSGLPQGIIERLIKGAGKSIGSLIPEDLPYLEQYLHPSAEILPRTSERPTRGGPPVPIVHRVPAEDDRNRVADMAERLGRMKAPPMSNVVKEIGGLGGATISEGPDYLSVYDTWDFDSPAEMFGLGEGKGLPPPLQQALDWIIKQGMSQVGEPFAVYERYPTTRK